MKLKYLCTLILGLFIFSMANAQLDDCTLGLGGKDTEVIAQVFQLNEDQLSKVDLWTGEVQAQNKLVEDQIKELFDKHPQSTHEELETLAKKYKLLKDKLVATSRLYDQKLLGLFNERQYQRYMELCNEALRRPMRAVKSSMDTIPE